MMAQSGMIINIMKEEICKMRKGLTEKQEAFMEKYGIEMSDPADIPDEPGDEEMVYDWDGNLLKHWIKGKLVYDVEEE